MKMLLLAILSLLFELCLCASLQNPFMRSAPLRCPIDNANTLDVKLFVRDEEECFRHCERTTGCHFYRYFSPHPQLSRSAVSSTSGLTKMPTQCYLFKSCGRNVVRAPPDCQLNSENTVQVVPFLKTEQKCKEICQIDSECGYYKYYPPMPSSSASDPSSSSDDTNALLESLNASANAVFSVSRSHGSHLNPESRSEFCYVLRSCAKRMVDNVECTLGKNNFLDMKMFVARLDDCRVHCLETEGCRYYHWYNIGRSDKPRYCYLFRQCAAKDEEPEVAFIIGGRHPGHYYLSSGEHNDFVMRSSVCMVDSRLRSNVGDVEVTTLARAGAVAAHIGNGVVLLCGGRGAHDEGEEQDHAKFVHDDCLAYDANGEGQWTTHSRMNLYSTSHKK